jgi:hypothetical protein
MVAKLKCVTTLQPNLPPNPKSFVVRNFFENVKEIYYFRRNCSTNKVDPSNSLDYTVIGSGGSMVAKLNLATEPFPNLEIFSKM